MIWKRKDPPKVHVVISITRVDEHTIALMVGGTRYHVNAGDLSRTLAKGVEIVAEVLPKM